MSGAAQCGTLARRAAHRVARHLVGDVGAHEDGGVAAKLLPDQVGDQHDALVVKVDALDGGERLVVGPEHRLHRLDHGLEELVRGAEDDHGGAARGLGQVGHRDHVGRQRALGQVLDVHVLGVDDVGQVLAVDLLLVHKHAHLVVEGVVPLGVAPEQPHERRAKVARADHRDLLLPARREAAAEVAQHG